jgi:hypothetical protein
VRLLHTMTSLKFSDDPVCPVMKAPKFDIERSPLSNQINYIIAVPDG